MSAGGTPVWRFGVYELNASSGELRKHGIRVKLQEQPRQILMLLLERTGEVVTREDIQQRLWPDGTFVDFDNAINTAVRKLREALSDSAENPRFIETLSRRGYRFAAPAALAAATTPAAPAPAAVSPAPQAIPLPAPPAVIARPRWPWIAGAVVLSAIAVVFIATKQISSASKVAEMRVMPLTANPGVELQPAFSNDGSRVAYSWNGGTAGGKFAIYVKLIGAGDPVLLTRDKVRDFSPAWSPDGRWVAALRDLGPQAAIILIPATGGQPRELARITKGSAADTACAQTDLPHLCGLNYWGNVLSWSPDGKDLFTSGQTIPDAPHSIIRVSATTSAQTAVTNPPSGISGDYGAVTSPDGRSLAFVRSANPKTNDVYVATLGEGPDTQPRKLTTTRADVESLAWGPEGHELIFSSNQSGRRELWSVAVSGPAIPKRLQNAGDDGSDVAVSRDGRRLVYNRTAYAGSLWKIPLDGFHAGPPIRITASTARDKYSHISPDGQRLVFQSTRTGVDEIWVSDADGKNASQLTNFGKGMSGSPRWSPDGRTIAFDSNNAGNFNIYLVDVSGGSARPLTLGDKGAAVPAWSRDGQWVYFMSSRTGRIELWKIRHNGTSEQQVTRNGGGPAAESLDGKTLYYIDGPGGDLWQMPTAGGPASKLLRFVAGRIFTVTGKGIYYGQANPSPQLHYFEFDTHADRTIGPLGAFAHADVAPDRTWLLEPVPSPPEANLLLVDNFH